MGGHDVSQILSVEEVDEWDGDATSGSSAKGAGLRGDGSVKACGNENDISLRMRNPKRNRSMEIRPVDMSRGSCASPMSARQRIQVLRERDSIDTDVSESMAVSMSSMSIASPQRAPGSSILVGDDGDLNFSARVDRDEEAL